MKDLTIFTDENNNQYIEIAGKRLPFSRKEEKQYGEHDFFDMNPSALFGPTQTKVSFEIGDLNYQVVYDNENPASNFEFSSKEQTDGQVEISVTYSLTRGGTVNAAVGTLTL